MPAETEKQAVAARIAAQVKKGKQTAEPGSASAEMAKMPMKSLKKFMHTKKSKKENIEGSLDSMYAVQKPYSGCEMTKLVVPFSPVSGVPMDQLPHDQIHGIFPDKERAISIASDLYEAHCAAEQALEEKKTTVTEKLKKAMGMLEKKRSSCMEMIKENPKESGKHKDTIANLTQKIDDLMTKLEKIEMSKKELKKSKKEKNKK